MKTLFLFSFAIEKYFDKKVTTVVNNSYELARSYVDEIRNKIQSDIHLYEDYINSIQYLEEFDEIFPAKKLGTLTQNIIDNLKETH